ncbi:hypothetical protein CHELA1G11_12207 [Hyphomicrobiales bacterium]|nr:hypothetical protein CHELA1G2_12105 [Hyphomicrobiales bacterium]CAH1663227.1 hypothetical protein CHELA1G11_12207 [Hyphomicrobiales bacterium]
MSRHGRRCLPVSIHPGSGRGGGDWRRLTMLALLHPLEAALGCMTADMPAYWFLRKRPCPPIS